MQELNIIADINAYDIIRNKWHSKCCQNLANISIKEYTRKFRITCPLNLQTDIGQLQGV